MMKNFDFEQKCGELKKKQNKLIAVVITIVGDLSL